MKTSKLFTINVDVADRLKNLNASELVNRLLLEYFELKVDKNTLKEEKTAVLKAIIKKKRYFPKKLRSLINGIRTIWIIIAKYGLKQGLMASLGMRPSLILGEGTLILKQKSLKMPLISSKNIRSSSNEIL